MIYSPDPLELLGWSHVSGKLWEKNGKKATYDYAVSYELARYAAQQSVYPTASGVGMLARFGNWLVRVGQWFIQHGGK